MLTSPLFRRVLLLPAMLLALWAPVQAQTVAGASPVAADPAYVLGPGDQIVLHVVDLDDLSDKPVRIDPNGFIDLPLAGRVEASGRTVEQLKLVLADKLKRYINSPQISINITDDQSRPVSILGEVNNPGVHQLHGPKRLLEVISMAGGLKSDAGYSVVITRQIKWGALPLPGAKMDSTQGFSTARLALDDLLASKNPADNIMVLPNDVVSVPKAEVVYVVGEVKKSGSFPLSSREAMSLLQAISLAEGFGRDASRRKARIMRPQAGDIKKLEEIPVDIQSILDGKAPDVQLYANDVLFVPNSLSKSSARRTAEAVLQAATGFAIYAR
jgi:polysaccharide export outer membrane protein